MKLILICLISLLSLQMHAQEIVKQLFDSYEAYHEKSIHDRRFKHADILPIIQKLEKQGKYNVKKLGTSIEGRSINMISIGKGKTPVLLWSQMHGDESTATMALMDLFNFFGQSDEFDDFKKLILDSLTLHFIPMLNPDGAERFQRRNAIEVDLNRDALRLQCPESNILKAARDSLNAAWGFNLHDQNRYYSAGISDQTASFSFLAPAYNYEKEINENRGNAMQLIGVLNELLQNYMPGKVGKYSDDFEPRAFGDNIQKWGTRTILIEVGGLENDREKQYLRKLHFVLLCKAFEAIALHSYENVSIEEYANIPFNDSNAFNELVVRNANIAFYDKHFLLDIAFRHYENHMNSKATDFYFSTGIQDIGDLSILHGYNEFDADGYEVRFGKLHPKAISSSKDISPDRILKDIQNGYTIYRSTIDFPKDKLDRLPISIVKRFRPIDQTLQIGKNPSILFLKNGQVKKLIVNGFLYDVEADKDKMIHALQEIN